MNIKLRRMYILVKLLGSGILPIYFLFLAGVAILPTQEYFNSATQATLLIICFPLLIINHLYSKRIIEKNKIKLDNRLFQECLIFPITVKHDGVLYDFYKTIYVEKNKDINASSKFLQYIEGDTLVATVHEIHSKTISTLMYKKKEQ